MSSVNCIYLVGNLVGDPELRFTPSRKAVLSFMLNVESESANIIPIQVWGSLAESCNIRLQKDSRIYLEGVLLVGDKTSVSKTLNFEDEEKYVEEEWYGEEIYVEEDYYSVRVVANKVKILGDQQQIMLTHIYND